MISNTEWENAVISDPYIARNLDRITIKELRNFTENAVCVYSTIQKLIAANRITDTFYELMKHRGQVTEENEQSFVNVYLVAGLLHNIFYDGTITSLYKAREALFDCAIKEFGIPANYTEKIFDAIEAQLGDKTPVAKCRPIPGHPEGDFALCRWFCEELHKKQE